MAKNKQNKSVICDTGVMSRVFSGVDEYVDAFEYIKSQKIEVFITSTIKMELHTWLIGYKNLLGIKKFEIIMQAINELPIIRMDKEISIIAELLSKKYHQFGVPDLLTSATALNKKLRIFTINIKHFEKIKGVKLYYPPNFE